MTTKWRLEAWSILLCFIVITWIRPSSAVYNIGPIQCRNTIEKLGLRAAQEVTVECPESCLSGHCKVVGSGPYNPDSYICCAAIHNGTLDNSKGGKVILQINHGTVDHFLPSTKFGVKSRRDFQSSSLSFITKKIHQPITTSTTTSSPHTTSEEAINEAFFTTTTTAAAATTTSTISTPLPLKNLDVTTKPATSTIKITESSDVTTKSLPKLEEKIESLKYESKAPKSKDTEETTQRSATTSYQYSESRTTGVVSHEKTRSQDPTAITSISQEIVLLPGHSTLSLASGIVVAFIGGIFCAVLFMCIRRKAKKNKHKRRKTCGSGTKKNPGLIQDEGEFCVCYQKMNSSKTGLLMYDPETCDRPCPIRQPSADNALMHDITMTKSFNNEKPANREGQMISSFRQVSKCEIRYEGECAEACSGACNPTQFDF